MSLLWGLDALAWVFRGADGGHWENIRTDCLPKLSGLILLLEARGFASPELMDMAVLVHEMASSDGQVGAAMQPENLEAEYVRLFINHRGGLGAPLCQSCYEDEALLMGSSAEAMQIRLDQAGLAVSANMLPPDHLSIQIEYLLSLFSEHAVLNQSAEAPATFAAKALQPWVALMEQKLVQSEATLFFRLCAGTLKAVVMHVGVLTSFHEKT